MKNLFSHIAWRAFKLLALLLITGSAPYSLISEAAQHDAGTVFQSIRPLVFQLKTAVSKDAPKSSYGTAFAVDRNGLLVSNYHVVSDTIQEDEKYQSFLMMGETPVPVEIVDIDVIHDLALIRIKKTLPGAISLSPHNPRQGSRIYSLGLPNDLNMSIIEGIYNGVIKYGIFDTIHVSAPLNGGMSGGPALDDDRNLIGVNVATLLGSHNISFFVPSDHVRNLIARNTVAVKKDSKKADFQQKIEAQLIEIQDQLSKDFLKTPDTKLSLQGWDVLKPVDYLKCWSINEDSKEKLFKNVRYTCHLNHSAYISRGIVTGTYEITYKTLESDRLNAVRFSRLEEMTANETRWESVYLNYFEKNTQQTRYECHDELISNKNKVTLKVNYCLRGYINYPHLLDADIKIVTLQKPKKALLTQARFKGFKIETIQAMTSALIQSVEEK